MEVEPLTLDYLAGFIDGEGCFSASISADRSTSKRRYCRCVLVVTSGAPDTLVRAQVTIGGGKVVLRTAPSRQRERWKASYRLTVLGADLDRFLPLIIPRLVIKREAATELLALRQLIAKSSPSGPLPARDWPERERIVARIHELNRRGV